MTAVEARFAPFFARGELKEYTQHDYRDGTRSKPITECCRHLMGQGSTSSLKRIKSPIKIYRGASLSELEEGFGQSWTLCKNKAKKFAYLYDGHSKDDSTVFEASVDKEHIFAYVNDRREKEVIVDVEHLKAVQVSPHRKQKTEV